MNKIVLINLALVGVGGRERIDERLGRKLDWGDAGDKKWNDYARLLIVGSRGMLHSTGHNMTFSLLPAANGMGSVCSTTKLMARTLCLGRENSKRANEVVTATPRFARATGPLLPLLG